MPILIGITAALTAALFWSSVLRLIQTIVKLVVVVKGKVKGKQKAPIFATLSRVKIEKFRRDWTLSGIALPMPLVQWLIVGGVLLVACFAINSQIPIYFYGSATLSFYLFIIYKSRKNLEKFRSQFPAGLDILVAALKAGYLLPDALIVTARELDFPANSCFSALVRGDSYALTLLDSAGRIGRILRDPDWEIFTDILKAHESYGGNLIPLFEDLATSIRDRQSVEQEALAATAGGRLSGIFVALIAPFSLILFSLLMPEYTEPLFHTALGNWLLVIAGFLEVLGIFTINKITKIEY